MDKAQSNKDDPLVVIKKIKDIPLDIYQTEIEEFSQPTSYDPVSGEILMTEGKEDYQNRVQKTIEEKGMLGYIKDNTIMAFKSDSFKQFYTAPATIPCFRESFLWGSGTAVALGVHRYLKTGDVTRMGKSIYLGFLVVGGINWCNCRYKKMKTRELYTKMKEVHEQRAEMGGKVYGSAWLDELEDGDSDVWEPTSRSYLAAGKNNNYEDF